VSSEVKIWRKEKIKEDPPAVFSPGSNFSALLIFPVSDMLLLPNRLEEQRKYGAGGTSPWKALPDIS
jgi:hypothetical protein